MKKQKLLFGLIFILCLHSCNSSEREKENALSKIAGNWSYGSSTVIKFARQDTVGLGILSSSLHDYVSSTSIEYPTGSVLFKSIKMFSDSSFVAKGLFIKPIFRTEDVQKYGWTGYKWGYYYEEEQIFDHFENTYVDYRLELRLNIITTLDGVANINCDLLTCIPFIEGKKWEFVRWISKEDLLRYGNKQIDEANRLVDSCEHADRNAEQKQIEEDSIKRAKRAQELLN